MVDKVRVRVEERNDVDLEHAGEGKDTDYIECGGIAQPGNILTLYGSVDPSAGAGVAAGIGSTYKRNTDGSFWKKIGAADVDWNEIAGSDSGPLDGGTASASYEGGTPVDGGSSSSTY